MPASRIKRGINKVLRRWFGLELQRVQGRSGPDTGAIQRTWDHTGPRRHKHYLALCTCFKNEVPYLREWIEYHRMLGVERFYLYDDGSDEDYYPTIAPYIRSGELVLRHVPDDALHGQAHSFPDCVANFGHEARWLICTDVDEFLLPLEDVTLPELLREYEEYPALAVHWPNFGTGGHFFKPAGLTIENFTRCGHEPQPTVKLIIDPHRIEKFHDVHHAVFRDGATAVTELFEPITKARQHPPTATRLRINHYALRSVEEFALRNKRGDVLGKTDKHNINRLVEREYLFSVAEDKIIQRYIPELKTRLATVESGLPHENSFQSPDVSS